MFFLRNFLAKALEIERDHHGNLDQCSDSTWFCICVSGTREPIDNRALRADFNAGLLGLRHRVLRPPDGRFAAVLRPLYGRITAVLRSYYGRITAVLRPYYGRITTAGTSCRRPTYIAQRLFHNGCVQCLKNAKTLKSILTMKIEFLTPQSPGVLF